ncbi:MULTISPECIES: hypothetical protein [Paraburkholderia]|uniref:hypothetical protein n=1 Tax=Paraburkholderia TaxID=1822464 RepID=UPI00224F26E4|nr:MULTISPECIES: hypothetical protein [Paraburkholderia]MCX4175666.1 hypothetical protein [Paraburkholderia madseniana]MDQ6463661.1 hypothetical protein [Paraburkholderia madseniana]
MADVLELVSFGLPPTFPPEAMPDAGAQFVKACWAGMTKGQLLTRARKLGWRPSWERQAHMVAEEGIEVYGFALVIDGCVVPLMARMRRVAGVTKPARPPERDTRQQTLF